MTYITKPALHHPSLTQNKVGYTRRDYEGRVGCNQLYFELG